MKKEGKAEDQVETDYFDMLVPNRQFILALIR